MSQIKQNEHKMPLLQPTLPTSSYQLLSKNQILIKFYEIIPFKCPFCFTIIESTLEFVDHLSSNHFYDVKIRYDKLNKFSRDTNEMALNYTEEKSSVKFSTKRKIIEKNKDEPVNKRQSLIKENSGLSEIFSRKDTFKPLVEASDETIVVDEIDKNLKTESVEQSGSKNKNDGDSNKSEHTQITVNIEPLFKMNIENSMRINKEHQVNFEASNISSSAIIELEKSNKKSVNEHTDFETFSCYYTDGKNDSVKRQHDLEFQNKDLKSRNPNRNKVSIDIFFYSSLTISFPIYVFFKLSFKSDQK